MTKITRKIETHKIFPATVAFKKGKIVTTPLDPIKVSNVNITEPKAIKMVKKTYGKTNLYVITKIETTRTTYALDIDKFLEIATPIKIETLKGEEVMIMEKEE